MSGCDLISSLKDECLDDILGIRDEIGAALAQVSIITRTWTGTQIGDGEYTDTVKEVLPTPGIKDYSHNVHVMQGGAIQQGDLLLRMISKNTFPTNNDVNCMSESPLTEKFYKVGDFHYRIISIIEKQLTWDIQVRRISDQTRGVRNG